MPSKNDPSYPPDIKGLLPGAPDFHGTPNAEIARLVAGTLQILAPNEIPFHPLSLLSTSQVAELFNVREATLEKWRLTGEGPPYVKLSGRVVRYTVSNLAEWIIANTRESTSDTGPAGAGV